MSVPMNITPEAALKSYSFPLVQPALTWRKVTTILDQSRQVTLMVSEDGNKTWSLYAVEPTDKKVEHVVSRGCLPCFHSVRDDMAEKSIYNFGEPLPDNLKAQFASLQADIDWIKSQAAPQATKPVAPFKPINLDDLKGRQLEADTRVKVHRSNNTIVHGTIKSHEGDNSFIVTLHLPTGEYPEERVDAANLMLIDELEKKPVPPVPPVAQVPLDTSDKTSAPKKKSTPRHPLEKQGTVHLDGDLEGWTKTTTASETLYTPLFPILAEGMKLTPIRSHTGALKLQNAFLANDNQPLTEAQCKEANIELKEPKKKKKQREEPKVDDPAAFQKAFESERNVWVLWDGQTIKCKLTSKASDPREWWVKHPKHETTQTFPEAEISLTNPTKKKKKEQKVESEKTWGVHNAWVKLISAASKAIGYSPQTEHHTSNLSFCTTIKKQVMSTPEYKQEETAIDGLIATICQAKSFESLKESDDIDLYAKLVGWVKTAVTNYRKLQNGGVDAGDNSNTAADGGADPQEDVDMDRAVSDDDTPIVQINKRQKVMDANPGLCPEVALPKGGPAAAAQEPTDEGMQTHGSLASRPFVSHPFVCEVDDKSVILMPVLEGQIMVVDPAKQEDLYRVYHTQEKIDELCKCIKNKRPLDENVDATFLQAAKHAIAATGRIVSTAAMKQGLHRDSLPSRIEECENQLNALRQDLEKCNAACATFGGCIDTLDATSKLCLSIEDKKAKAKEAAEKEKAKNLETIRRLAEKMDPADLAKVLPNMFAWENRPVQPPNESYDSDDSVVYVLHDPTKVKKVKTEAKP